MTQPNEVQPSDKVVGEGQPLELDVVRYSYSTRRPWHPKPAEGCCIKCARTPQETGCDAFWWGNCMGARVGMPSRPEFSFSRSTRNTLPATLCGFPLAESEILANADGKPDTITVAMGKPEDPQPIDPDWQPSC